MPNQPSGFSSLPDQYVNSLKKDGFQFNILCIGTPCRPLRPLRRPARTHAGALRLVAGMAR